MKNKIIIIVLMVLAIISIVVGFVMLNLKSTVPETEAICNDVSTVKKNNGNFMLVIEKKNSNLDALKEFSEEYNELKVLRASYKSIDNDCFKEELKGIGLYDLVEAENSTVYVFYKEGKYVGVMGGVVTYDNLESYAIKKELVTKHEIEEAITLDSFKENIKGKYILIITVEEKARKIIEPLAVKHLSSYKYDIVDRKSKVGLSIYKYVKENYKLGSGFPQALYFENGKLLVNGEVYNLDEDYHEFIDNIKKLNEKDS